MATLSVGVGGSAGYSFSGERGVLPAAVVVVVVIHHIICHTDVSTISMQSFRGQQ